MNRFQLKLALSFALGVPIMIGAVSSVQAVELQVAGEPEVVKELDGASGIYIVRLAAPPVATYEGGIAGLKATSARSKGQKRLDTNSGEAKAYANYLLQEQKKVLASAGSTLGRQLTTSYTYQFAYNGFAVELTTDEARRMKGVPGVIAVERERIEQLDTDAGPTWIGAPEIWVNPPSSTRGEGVVVAVLDTGINFDHPSFADVGGDGYNHSNPLGSGNYLPGSYCDTTNPAFCNDKLIGAWSFVTEAVTPNDSDGHGSHTASTAAGNVVNPAVFEAPTTTASFAISGVAPHANIIAYDVCIVTCPGAALLAAVNQVLIDAGNLPNGIAALNYSISGGDNPYNDAVELGFLAAVEAGVYVATSAGNSGPGASTVGHQGPWVSATAATTHDRVIENSLIDIDSAGGGIPDITGQGLTSGYGPAPIINSADLEGDFPGSTLCGVGEAESFTPPWPAGTFNGEIVACTRGTYGRVEKGANVLAAGAGGYILIDNGTGLTADAHVLPGVHITQADGAALTAWLAANAGNNPMGTISGYSLTTDPAAADVVGGFSSRGPGSAKLDVLKPDLAAPGLAIFGAAEDGSGPAPEYQFLQGTSMASPHNAGAAALLAALHPSWTPQQIKSAIMLTASTEFTVKEDGFTPSDAFDVGAGRIDLGAAKDAGLVMSETIENFLDADPALGGDPKTLNLASMMDDDCYHSCSWSRTVTNVTNNVAHWNVTADAPAGVDLEVAVSPAANSGDYNLKLKKGQSGTIEVSAETTFAPEGWHFATVDLDRNLVQGPDLHMPVAIYAAKSTDSTVFSKTVDAATAEPGDTLSYELVVTGAVGPGPITVTDIVPEGTSFVENSETESVVNGSTTSPWAYDEGSNSLSWTGLLEAGVIDVVAATPGPGYDSLANYFAPRALPANRDEGGFLFNAAPFTFNGQTYTQLIWSVNGTVQAGTVGLSTSGFINRLMPNALTPNNLIAPLWTDLDYTSGGQFFAGNLTDGAGSTYLIFEWKDVPYWGQTNDRATFQIWIGHNGTLAEGKIHFTYARLDNLNGGFATIGAENSTGTVGDTWYYNNTGTAPVVGTDLSVAATPGSATLGFQVVTDGCEDIINVADATNGSNEEEAFATTTCQ